MSSPRLGVFRDPSKTKKLIEASVGKSQPRALALPPADISYGVNDPNPDGGMAVALSSWRVQSSPVCRHAVPDFITLNRDAARSGLVTAKEVGQFRAQRGGVTISEPIKSPQHSRKTRLPVVPDITHGIATRATSPIARLLSHHYGRRWIEDQQNRMQAESQGKKGRVKGGRISDTRTSLLRRSRAHTHSDTPLITPRLAQVPPCLDTFRSEEERCRALRAHR